jgi:hypothetical protein
VNGDQSTEAWLDERLEAWLVDGPPPSDALLQRTLGAVATHGQRRLGRWPWSLLRVASYGWTAVLAAGVVVALVALVAPRGITPPVGGPTESAAPTPGWDERFPNIYVGDFQHAFTYAIDPASGLILTSWPDPYQFRVPRGPRTDNFDEGVILHTVAGGLRSDVCRAAGGQVDTDPSPEEVVSAIQALDGLEVSPVETTTIDGRPAMAVTVSGTQHRTCEAYYLFDDFEPAFAWSGNEGRTRRVIAVDVGGDAIIVEITASDERYDAWVPTAEAFIDSIHFDPP